MVTGKKWAPVAQERIFDWEKALTLPIEECREELVPASLVPDKLLVHPIYFLNGIEGALPECYVRRGVLTLLLEAADRLPPGFRLVLLDGWRPVPLQTALFNKYREELREAMPFKNDEELGSLATRFVASPSSHPERPSPHLTGGAVDITIVDDKGFCLYMGSSFDETTDRSGTAYYEKKASSGGAMPGKTLEALDNRRMLFAVMTGAGFTNFPDEWWHFDYGNQNWAFMKGKKSAFYGIVEPGFRWKRDNPKG